VHEKYLGKFWSENLREAFKFFYLFGGYYRKMKFVDWCKNEGKNNNHWHFTKKEIKSIGG
jgi:hypothetical protein